MKIISIAGTASNTGKTSVAEFLIRYLTSNFPIVNEAANCKVSALKITTRHKGKCIKGSCGVCDSIKYPFVIINDEGIINQTGKDTARLKSAGAAKVVWLLSFPETLKDGIKTVLESFGKDDIVIVEGNSFLKEHDVDLSILVTRPNHTSLKDSTKHIIEKIDFAIINKEDKTSDIQIKECKEWLQSVGCNAATVTMNPLSETQEHFMDTSISKKVTDVVNMDH